MKQPINHEAVDEACGLFNLSKDTFTAEELNAAYRSLVNEIHSYRFGGPSEAWSEACQRPQAGQVDSLITLVNIARDHARDYLVERPATWFNLFTTPNKPSTIRQQIGEFELKSEVDGIKRICASLVKNPHNIIERIHSNAADILAVYKEMPETIKDTLTDVLEVLQMTAKEFEKLQPTDGYRAMVGRVYGEWGENLFDQQKSEFIDLILHAAQNGHVTIAPEVFDVIHELATKPERATPEQTHSIQRRDFG